MNTKELRRGNAVLHNDKYLIVENVNQNSINMTFEKGTDPEGKSVYHVKNWISKDLIFPISLNSDTLKRLGFRKETDTRFKLKNANRSIFVVRRINKFFLAVDNAFNEVAEVKSIHHLQNFIYDWFTIDLKFK